MHAYDVTAEPTVRRGTREISVRVHSGRPHLRATVDSVTIADIALGIVADGHDLGDGASILATSRRSVEENFTLHVGKSVGDHHVDHEELRVDLRTGRDKWAIIVRVARDGFALRYELPEGAHVLGLESTTLTVGSPSRVWALDYTPWYETVRFGTDLDALPRGDYGLPLLVNVGPDHYLLISESDIDGQNSGARTSVSDSTIRILAADDSNAVGDKHRTPWRVMITGALRDIVASTLVDELARPAKEDAFLPRPGRAAWSWWSSQYSGAYLSDQQRFCDFAAEQGWEHLLVDCGWDASWVPELVSYASARGIQVHLWSSWSDLDGDDALRQLGLWRSWGVAGVKVDFMESESRTRYEWYDAILAEAARVGLMVNFHGSVIPRGWGRTHPHVVSFEAIRGAEWYVFYGQPLPASHNVIQPFTRNVVGSMDYTPVTFSAPGRETTDAHELALSVVFESGITHFADAPEHYRARPIAARFLGEVPSVWDATVLVDGHPDERAILARRRGDRWFVGGISALGHATTVHLDTSIFGSAPTTIWVVRDGVDGLMEATITASGQTIEIPVHARGGFVAIVAPLATEIVRSSPRVELTRPTVEDSIVVLDQGALIRSSARDIRLPDGWRAEARGAGTWWVAPLVSVQPGAIAVVTLESPGHDGVPVVCHARVLAPLRDQAVSLATLPFLASSNAVGPVERGLANGGGDPNDGAPLTVMGEIYADGIGVSQVSAVEFAITGSLRHCRGAVAIDDETPEGQATAVIEVDGRAVVSLTIAGGQPPTPFEVDITGADRLSFRTFPHGNDREAHVDWLNTRLVP